MRTVFAIVLLAIGVSAFAAETQVKQQDIKGDCNVALGINHGKVEVKCGLHEAALKPLADKLNALQRKETLRDAQVNDLLDGVNHMMSIVISTHAQTDKKLERIESQVDLLVKNQAEKVQTKLPEQAADIERFKQEAQEYRKKYEDLLAQWNTVQGDEQANLAMQALQAGDLDRAGKILDEILAAQDKVAEKTATNHYQRGGIFELQFKPHEALEQYDAAYRGAPKNFQYSHTYAVLLQGQNEFRKAVRVYEDNLEALRELAQKNPEAYEPNLAAVLNNLGNLYGATQRFAEAEKSYIEARDLYRKLAQKNPEAYEPDLAAVLNNLGVLYRATQRLAEAEKAYGEALALYRKYAERSPEVFEKDVRRVERLVAELKGDAPKPVATEPVQIAPKQ